MKFCLFFFFVERRLEDHEAVVHVLESWPREGNNTISFTNRPDKYMLLKRPQVRRMTILTIVAWASSMVNLNLFS